MRQAVVFNDMAQFVDCRSCFRQVTTEVTSEVSPRGWMWAILCCLFGSWILSYLVNCFPGFRRYTHTCPQVPDHHRPDGAKAHNLSVRHHHADLHRGDRPRSARPLHLLLWTEELLATTSRG